MNAHASFRPDPAQSADADPWGRDAVAERDARRQARLDELAELGMGLARRVARAGEDADAALAAAELASLSMAFGRVSRAVRLTEALADRLDHPPAAAPSENPYAMDPQAFVAARHRVRGKLAKLVVRATVIEAIEAEARERGDGYDTERLIDEMDRMIGGPETIDEFATTSHHAMAARICAAVSLSRHLAIPDPSPIEGEGRGDGASS